MSRRSPLFTDLYQLTMARAYLASSKARSPAVFELFFRSCPFDGEYAVFSGLDAVKEILENFSFDREEIHFLKREPSFAHAEQSFFDELESLDLKDIEVFALDEGQLAFPRLPLLQVRGPLFKLQLLETALLNAVNFASLVATYARRIKCVIGHKKLIEFGMRRAQGPNGAMCASRSSYLGGADGSSNVLAGKEFGIPLVGTMAHSFVQSFWEVRETDLKWGDKDISKLFEEIQKEDGKRTNLGELGAFLAYAKVFPDSALLLVDTYDTIKSGVPNAIRIFKLLRALGHQPAGIRLDSGDLVYLSQESRRMLDEAGFKDAKIFASNELHEEILDSIQKQGALIDGYGVGTHLVTCSQQPALGGVYKLVEVDGRARLKKSEQTEKMVLPSAKQAYRLYGKDGMMILDLLCKLEEKEPQVGQPTSALHPFNPFKRAVVIPERVERLLHCVFKGGSWQKAIDLPRARSESLERMKCLRPDISRRHNPTPYKVSVSPKLKESFESLYFEEHPPAELR